VGAPAAQRADVEQLARQRQFQRRIVELGIVRQRDQRRGRVEPEPGQRLVRPFVAQLHAGKALGRGKGAARIDHRDFVTGRRRHAARAWAICTAPTISRRGAGT
jgi:hypothetical protein